MQDIDARLTNRRALKTYVFYCSNHPDGNQLANCSCGGPGDEVKTIGLPCSGKIDLPYLVKAFETGADGVVLLSCKEAECRHLEGTARAHKRAEAVESLLEEIGLGRGRMAVLEWDQNGLAKVLGDINDFLEKVRRLPQLPAQSTDEKERAVA